MNKYYFVLAAFLIGLQSQAQTTTATVPATTEQTSTTKVESAAAAVASPFSVSIFMLGGYNDQQFYNERPSFTVMDSYIALNYNVTKDIRVSARPAFGYTTSGLSSARGNRAPEEVSDKASIRDFSFAGSIRNIMSDTLQDSLALKFKPRLFLATSDRSKDEGMIARLRLEWELKYYTSKTSDLRIILKPNYYFQKDTAVSSTDSRGRVSFRGTRLADAENYVEFTQDIGESKTFAIKPVIGQDDEWSNKSAANGINDTFRKSRLFYGAGFEISPTRDLQATLGVRTYKDVYQPANSEETSYTLMVDAQVF